MRIAEAGRAGFRSIDHRDDSARPAGPATETPRSPGQAGGSALRPRMVGPVTALLLPARIGGAYALKIRRMPISTPSVRPFVSLAGGRPGRPGGEAGPVRRVTAGEPRTDASKVVIAEMVSESAPGEVIRHGLSIPRYSARCFPPPRSRGMAGAPPAVREFARRPTRIPRAHLGAGARADYRLARREMVRYIDASHCLADPVPSHRRATEPVRPVQQVPRLAPWVRDRPAGEASRRGFVQRFGPPPEIFRSSGPSAGRSGSGFQLPETSRKHWRPEIRYLTKLLWALCLLPHVMPGGPNLGKAARRKVHLRSASGCLVSMSETKL